MTAANSFLDEQGFIDGEKSSAEGEDFLSFDNDIANLDELQIADVINDEDEIDTIVPKETVQAASDDNFNLDAFLNNDADFGEEALNIDSKEPVMNDFAERVSANGTYPVSENIMSAFVGAAVNDGVTPQAVLESTSIDEVNSDFEGTEERQEPFLEKSNLDEWMMGDVEDISDNTIVQDVSEEIVTFEENSENIPLVSENVEEIIDFTATEEIDSTAIDADENVPEAMDFSEFHFDNLEQTDYEAQVLSEDATEFNPVDADVIDFTAEPEFAENDSFEQKLETTDDVSDLNFSEEVMEPVLVPEEGNYDIHLGSSSLPAAESVENPNYVKWYSGTSYDEFFEVSKQSLSTTIMGDAYRHSIHVNVGYDTYGWQVSFSDGTIMNLRDVREYQLRNGRLPNEKGTIIYGNNHTGFISIDRIVIYESVEYFSYGV